MELVVDLQAVTVVLSRPEDLARLAVRVGSPATASPAEPADVHRLNDVLAAAHIGRLDGADALVDPEALRFHAAGAVGPEWEDGFAAMLEGAGAHGWVKEGLLQAHVTWPEGAS